MKLAQQCPCQGDDANQIWNTDIDHFHRGGLILAWIDHRSPMCLGFKFLPEKSSAETAKPLCETLQHYPVPCPIWTDNGKEFEGFFQALLKARGIRHICSAPYNPRENGKCERYWRTIEMAPKVDNIPALLAEYKGTPHFGLPPIKRTKPMGCMTLVELWNDMGLQLTDMAWIPQRQWMQAAFHFREHRSLT